MMMTMIWYLVRPKYLHTHTHTTDIDWSKLNSRNRKTNHKKKFCKNQKKTWSLPNKKKNLELGTKKKNRPVRLDEIWVWLVFFSHTHTHTPEFFKRPEKKLNVPGSSQLWIYVIFFSCMLMNTGIWNVRACVCVCGALYPYVNENKTPHIKLTFLLLLLLFKTKKKQHHFDNMTHTHIQSTRIYNSISCSLYVCVCVFYFRKRVNEKKMIFSSFAGLCVCI